LDFLNCPIAPSANAKVTPEECETRISSGTCSVYWNHLVDVEDEEILAEELAYAESQEEENEMKKKKVPEIKGVRMIQHTFTKADADEVQPKVYTQAGGGHYGWN